MMICKRVYSFLLVLISFMHSAGGDAYYFTPQIRRAIHREVTKPSCFPDLPRKNYKERFHNCLEFYKKGGPIRYYNTYGLDVKNFRNRKDFWHRNNSTWKNENINYERQKVHPYKDLGPKKEFHQYFDKLFPNNIAKNLFFFHNGRVTSEWLHGADFMSALQQVPDGDYFCKQSNGSLGIQVFLITKKDKTITINNGQVSLQEFLQKWIYTNREFVFEEKLIQHPDIAKLNPSSPNTIRIVTTHFNNKTHVLAAILRIGSRKDALVDNVSLGGTAAAINLNTGKLSEFGVYYDKPRKFKHPVSGITYEWYQIPYWNEVVELVKKMHDAANYYNSLGWDVLVTEDGPKVIELNTCWMPFGLQAANGGLRVRWDMLKRAE